MRFRLIEVEMTTPIQQNNMLNGQKYVTQMQANIVGKVRAEEIDLVEVERIAKNGIYLVPEDMAIPPSILKSAVEMSLYELTNIRGLLKEKTGKSFYSQLPNLEYKNDGDSVSVLKILLAISSDVDKIKTILENDATI